ncbi:MAG: hypothetical protein LBI30_00775 [Holosporales bacterium]|nr:hypothetical protein [Holosporales bacterium]
MILYRSVEAVFMWPFVLCWSLIFVSSAAITRGMISLGIVDRLTKRSLHTKPTPRAGGIAIVSTYLFSILTLYNLNSELFDTRSSSQLYAILGTTTAIVAISFYDDIRSISYLYRLFFQLVCAIAIVQSGIGLNRIWLPYVGYIRLSNFEALLNVLWIVSFINIFNFMDGVDGMVSGCSILGCAFLSLIANNNGDRLTLYSLMVMIPATAGFFIFNFPKAKIFMGDVGSHFQGLLFALHEINISARASDDLIPGLTTVVIVGNFVFDVAFTLIRRLASGKSIVKPHNEFLFHILYKSGWSHVKISLLHFGFVVFQGTLVCFSSSKTALALSALAVLTVQSIYAYSVLHMRSKIAAGD